MAGRKIRGGRRKGGRSHCTQSDERSKLVPTRHADWFDAIVRQLIRRAVPRSVRNWVRAPRKSLRWLWDEARYAAGVDLSLELRPGWTVHCHPAAYRVYREAQIADPVQASELDHFITQCSPGMVLLDLGAHYGAFSLAALEHGGAEAAAIAVEPSPSAARILAIQGRLNRVTGRLHVVRAAVSDIAGTQPMLDVGVLADGYLVAADSVHPQSDFVEVPTVTIDSLVDDLGRRPTHIKIDVEGFEAAVLRGGMRRLSTDPRPILFVELHNQMVRDRGGDPAEALGMLSEMGYDTLSMDGRPVPAADLLALRLARVVARGARQ